MIRRTQPALQERLRNIVGRPCPRLQSMPIALTEPSFRIFILSIGIFDGEPSQPPPHSNFCSRWGSFPNGLLRAGSQAVFVRLAAHTAAVSCHPSSHLAEGDVAKHNVTYLFCHSMQRDAMYQCLPARNVLALRYATASSSAQHAANPQIRLIYPEHANPSVAIRNTHPCCRLAQPGFYCILSISYRVIVNLARNLFRNCHE